MSEMEKQGFYACDNKSAASDALLIEFLESDYASICKDYSSIETCKRARNRLQYHIRNKQLPVNILMRKTKLYLIKEQENEC